MRALLLSDFYPPVLGGLELQVQALARALVARGHDVSVASLTLDPPHTSDEGGVTVHRLRGWNRLLGPFYEDRSRPFHPTLPDPGVVAALRGIVATERPQAVFKSVARWDTKVVNYLCRKDVVALLSSQNGARIKGCVSDGAGRHDGFLMSLRRVDARCNP